MNDVHETEKYVTIDDFPDYLVTSQGRVFSLKYDKMKELKQTKNKDGYLKVILSKNGKQYSKTVHRLVAQAFIPNHDNKPCVNHIDENKSNNNVKNLEWCTYKENNNHGTRNERVSQKNSISHKGKKHSGETKAKISKSNKGLNHPRAKSVVGFKVNGCDIKYYKFINECEKDEFNSSCISMCCRKRIKTHKGYVWYYADEFFNKKE